MSAARRARVLALLAAQNAAQSMPDRVCAAVVEALPVSGAGLSLIGGARGHRILVHGTDATSRRLEDLQLTLGVGPCMESINRGGPVLVPDLGRQSDGRWPGFVGPALAAGVRAIFAFPLQIGAVCLGALDLYRDTVGGLGDEELADMLVFADVVTLALLSTPDGEEADGDGADGEGAGLGVLTDWLASADTAVYQASGMVMVQLGVTIGQAMLRLRAHAFVNDQTVTATAHEILGRRLRLDPDPHPEQ